MLFVATDEAGYGPKLGPLVIAAAVGQAEDLPVNNLVDAIANTFRSFADPVLVGSTTVRIDDSKSVFKSGAGLSYLHSVVSASHHWCRHSCRTVAESLQHVAHDDLSSIGQSPWLGCIRDEPLTLEPNTVAAISHWRSGGFDLEDIQARIITADQFNQACRSGFNKADLLTESTLGLIRSVIASKDQQLAYVYCDRHGGRRYYAGAITHTFDGAVVQIICENQGESVYQLKWKGRSIRIAFTVKGDRFGPVALASMHAKYWRERMMESLNAYFQSLHQPAVTFKPTAGYPVDADRFLQDIQCTLDRIGIQQDRLVRSR